MEPVLLLLALCAAAAGAAALGVLPLVGRSDTPLAGLGGANAVAAGMMLGAAYLLTAAQVDAGAVSAALGAVIGIAFILGTHYAAGTETTTLNRLSDQDPAYGYQLLLISGLHSASEGVAIGVAMIIDVELGIFMAVAIALHNVPEGTVLSAILRSRGIRLIEAAGLAIAANAGQVLLAVTVFSVVSVAPAFLPWALGFAVGTLVQLSLMELLPESYRQSGHTSIATATVVALGVVVLTRGLVP